MKQFKYKKQRALKARRRSYRNTMKAQGKMFGRGLWRRG